MAQFRACRIAGGRLVLNLQVDLIEWDPRARPTGVSTSGPKSIERLEPVFAIGRVK